MNDRPLSPGFWSTQTLRDRLGEIVSPYDDRSRTREANHRLTMGSEYFVTQSALDTHAARESTKCLKPGESFCIPSVHFGFLLTEEHICMPEDAIGFLSMKTDVKFLGLVNISGFHVDPGSNGKIIFAVFNAGPDPVHIRRGDSIFRLWIASLDAVDEAPRSRPSYDSIPSEVVNRISGELESLQTLAKRIGSMEARLNFHRGMVIFCGGLLIAILIALVVAIAQDWISFRSSDSAGELQRSSIHSASELVSERASGKLQE